MRKVICFLVVAVSLQLNAQNSKIKEYNLQGKIYFEKAQYNLAYMSYYESAKLGDLEAKEILGTMIFKNQVPNINTNDYKQVLDWFLELEKNGSKNFYIYRHIGWLYHANFTGIIDLEKAILYFKKAADLGDSWAMYWLGVNYFNKKEYREAYHYLEKSSKLKDYEATQILKEKFTDEFIYSLASKELPDDEIRRLNEIYDGKSFDVQELEKLDEKYVKAVYWLEISASNGHLKSMEILGSLYYNTAIVNNNLDLLKEALDLLHSAKLKGSSNAKKMLTSNKVKKVYMDYLKYTQE